MTYDELSPEQKLQAKQNYLIGLADDGVFIRTIYGNNANEAEREPSYGELAAADQLVSDDIMRRQAVSYVPEDFEIKDGPIEQLQEWLLKTISMSKFKESNPGIGADATAQCYVCWALDWARGEVYKKCEELLKDAK